MAPQLESLHRHLSDGEWTYPLLAGVVAAAFVLFDYWRGSSDTLNLGPVFFAGVVGGVLCSGRQVASRRLGFRTGLVGGVAVLVPLFDVLAAIPGFAQPAWFGAVQTVMMVAVAVLAVSFAGVVGAVGAMLGEWLVGRISRRRGTAASN